MAVGLFCILPTFRSPFSVQNRSQNLMYALPGEWGQKFLETDHVCDDDHEILSYFPKRGLGADVEMSQVHQLEQCQHQI